MPNLRVVIASPGDIHEERELAAQIVKELAEAEPTVECVEIFLWEKNVPPGFSREPIQIGLIDPQARIADSDILIVLFAKKLGSPIAPGRPTGTEHEFTTAYQSWRETKRPYIMVYFKDPLPPPANWEEAKQLADLWEFRSSFPREGLYQTFKDRTDFEAKLRQHLPIVFKKVSERVKKPFSEEDFKARIHEEPVPGNYRCLQVPASKDLFSSFHPERPGKQFLRLKILTTSGLVPNPEYRGESEDRWVDKDHSVYLIRDPIRPFEIQIGEYRAQRYGREPREVPFEGVPGHAELQTLYPLIQDPGHRWLRIVFAELLSDPEALRYMKKCSSGDEGVRKIIARNPSAPEDVKKGECIFCDGNFRGKRKISKYDTPGARIIANDFPFGPYFHYIVFPSGEVHSWDNVKEKQLFDINWLAYQHLKDEYKRNELGGAAGLRIGLNSSIRHLVLGRRTRTSAGASVAHVHKQIWGMAPHSVNLADQLRAICLAYERQSPPIDYLQAYYEVLQNAGLVIWEDEDRHVAIYVPFGQIAVHELQIMIRKPGRPTFLDLEEPEIKALSQAEWIVTQLYSRLDINSFNEILLSLPFNDTKCKTFRLIFTFITREVDLAVSELSLLYVVDQHPSHTVREINRVWPSRNPDDLRKRQEQEEEEHQDEESKGRQEEAEVSPRVD